MLREATKTEDLPRGYRGTDKTIKRMHPLVAKAKLDPTMHRIATWIRLSVPDDPKGSGRKTAEAIFDWVRRHGIFQRDQFQIERIEHPVSSMQSIVKARLKGAYQGPGLFVGDCDQYAIWVATLGGILGFQYAFETAKTDPVRPDEFSHVWTSLLVGKEWLPLDASTPRAYPGWRPPVGPERLKRWPEREIGGQMNGLNGRANGYYPGLADSPSGRYAWEGNFVPQDYFGWGMPRDFDYFAEEPVLTDTDPSRLDMLVPQEPAIPEAELEPGAELIRKYPPPHPSHRPSLTQGDENFTTGPRYAPKGPRPYYKVRSQFYPPGSKFNRRVVSDVDRSKLPRGTFYHTENLSNVPVRDVDVVMGKPAALKRKRGMTTLQRRTDQSIIMRPRRLPAGMGQGEEEELASLQASTGKVESAAKEAGTSVWDTITSVISDAAKAGASILTERTKAKYAERVANATNRVAGSSVASASDYYVPEEESSPWYTSPWLWIGGALVVGGVGYAVLRSRSRGGRRRRYRRNPVLRRRRRVVA